MNSVPAKNSIRWLRGWLLLTLGGTLATFWKAPYPQEIWLQHLPTAFGLVWIGWLIEGRRLSPSSLVCLLLFLGLHIVGARWIYSYVPHDRWLSDSLGFSLSSTLGWTRNHYDRLVHLMSGVLFVPPAWEVIRWHGLTHHGWLAVLSVSVVLAIGATYEVLEWGVAMLFAPHYAESYNGQQGDLWDPQKDLALAGIGAIVTALGLSVRASTAAPVQTPLAPSASSDSPTRQ